MNMRCRAKDLKPGDIVQKRKGLGVVNNVSPTEPRTITTKDERVFVALVLEAGGAILSFCKPGKIFHVRTDLEIVPPDDGIAAE
jgi:hypothetical protein